MKKIKFNVLTLFACAFLVLWTGCASEMGDNDKDKAHPTQPETFTTFAAQAMVPTRTTLSHTIGNGADVFWEAGDNIWIDQIKRHKKTGRRKILLRCEGCLMV